MRIAVGSDHAGFAMKSVVAKDLATRGYEVSDLGTSDATTSVDYPDFAAAVARAVASGTADVGVLVCGTGIGMAISANKIAGVRAAVVHDVTTARLAKEHNHANVICLGARVIGDQVALDAVSAWLDATAQSGRHDARVAKIGLLDDELVGDKRK